MSTSSQTPTLDQIAASGNAPDRTTGERPVDNRITCADGFSLSVIAGAGYYCTPRPSLLSGLPDGLVSNEARDYPGPYTAVEVGFPSARPEPWSAWMQRAEPAWITDPDCIESIATGLVDIPDDLSGDTHQEA